MIHFNLFLNSFADRCVMADPFDIQGPSFTIEPPHHLEFTNIVDNHVDCVVKGSPPPKIEWLHLDNTPVTTIPKVSIFPSRKNIGTAIYRIYNRITSNFIKYESRSIRTSNTGQSEHVSPINYLLIVSSNSAYSFVYGASKNVALFLVLGEQLV